MDQNLVVEDVISAASAVYQDLQYCFPADVREIARYMGVEYFEKRLPFRVNGLYHRDKAGSLLCVNNYPQKDDSIRRQAAGHELGHHVIIGELGVRQAFLLASASSEYMQPAEEMCNLFMRCLLMPETPFRSAWEEWGSVRKVSDYFGVKPAQIRKRLEELGLS